MSTGFFDKRREFREPVRQGIAVAGTRAWPVRNWSRRGVLIGSADLAEAIGERVRIHLEIVVDGECFSFPATLLVVRIDPRRTETAGLLTDLAPADAAAVDAHFNLGPMVLPAGAPGTQDHAGAIETAVDEIIAANPAQVEKAKQNPKLAGWFVGQVMKATGGKANPKAVNEIVARKLG